MVRNSGRFPDVFFYGNTICGIEPRTIFETNYSPIDSDKEIYPGSLWRVICRIASQREGIAGGFATYLDGKSKKEIGINLSLLMLHKELEPIRNPIFINQMSKEDRDRAKKIWDEVRTLYEMTFDTEISQN